MNRIERTATDAGQCIAAPSSRFAKAAARHGGPAPPAAAPPFVGANTTSRQRKSSSAILLEDDDVESDFGAEEYREEEYAVVMLWMPGCGLSMSCIRLNGSIIANSCEMKSVRSMFRASPADQG